MFKEQARRLLRTVWRTPQKLAEELFAILDSDGPLEHKGTLDLTPDGDQPVIRIVLPGPIPDGFNPIQVVHPNPDGGFDPVGFVPLAPDPDAPGTGGVIDTSGGGTGNTLPDRDDSGDASDPDDRQDDPRQTPVTALGRVVSGSGSEYTVGVWLNDPDGGDAGYWMVVPARVVQIDAAEQVPAGTVVLVTLVYPRDRQGVVAYFQPPVTL